MMTTKEISNEIYTPVRIEGLESFIAGFHTIAKSKTIGKKDNSQMILSIGICRPHQQTCYINVSLNTNLTTGLTQLESITEQLTSVFHKGGQLTNFSASSNKTSSAKAKSVKPAAISKTDEIEDAIDDILDIVS